MWYIVQELSYRHIVSHHNSHDPTSGPVNITMPTSPANNRYDQDQKSMNQNTGRERKEKFKNKGSS